MVGPWTLHHEDGAGPSSSPSSSGSQGVRSSCRRSALGTLLLTLIACTQFGFVSAQDQPSEPSLSTATTTTTTTATATATATAAATTNSQTSSLNLMQVLSQDKSASLFAGLLSSAPASSPFLKFLNGTASTGASTVLAFTDTALATLDATRVRELTGNTALTAQLLSYHVIPETAVDLRTALKRLDASGSDASSSFANALKPAADSFAAETALTFRREDLPNPPVRLVFGKNQSVVFSLAAGATPVGDYYLPTDFQVSCGNVSARIVDYRIASNGIIYLVDKVLIPPTSFLKTVKEYLSLTEYSTWLSLAAESQILASLHDITVFIPTNAGARSFSGTESDIMDAASRGRAAVVQLHVVPGVYYAQDLAKLASSSNPPPISTYYLNETLTLQLDASSGSSAVIPYTRLGFARTSSTATKTPIRIVRPDVPFDGGVIHIVNSFLRPADLVSQIPDPVPLPVQKYPSGFSAATDPLASAAGPGTNSTGGTRPAPNSDDLEASANDFGHDFPTGAVVGGGLGGLVFLAMVGGVAYIIVRRRRIVRRERELRKQMEMNAINPDTGGDGFQPYSYPKGNAPRESVIRGEGIDAILSPVSPPTATTAASADFPPAPYPPHAPQAVTKLPHGTVALNDLNEDDEEDEEEDDDEPYEYDDDYFAYQPTGPSVPLPIAGRNSQSTDAAWDKEAARSERDRIIEFRRSQWSAAGTSSPPSPSPAQQRRQSSGVRPSSYVGGASVRGSLDSPEAVSPSPTSRVDEPRRASWRKSTTSAGGGRKQAPTTPGNAPANNARSSKRMSTVSASSSLLFVPTGSPSSPAPPLPSDPTQARKEKVRESWWSNTGVSGKPIADPVVAENQARREAQRRSWWSGSSAFDDLAASEDARGRNGDARPHHQRSKSEAPRSKSVSAGLRTSTSGDPAQRPVSSSSYGLHLPPASPSLSPVPADPAQQRKERVRESWWSNTGVSGQPIADPAVAEAQARREAQRKSWWSGQSDLEEMAAAYGLPNSPSTPPPPTTPGGFFKRLSSTPSAAAAAVAASPPGPSAYPFPVMPGPDADPKYHERPLTKVPPPPSSQDASGTAAVLGLLGTRRPSNGNVLPGPAAALAKSRPDLAGENAFGITVTPPTVERRPRAGE
ncbi:hypothetical protein HDU96_002323 [Phlyctochytrium bullatum]|nr:hypothetical protein HDU96_002323 [Phlyctochytrium bullatum]